MECGKEKREQWYNTCMIPLTTKELQYARRIRYDAINSSSPYISKCDPIIGLCGYCKTKEATHHIHGGNILHFYIKYCWFCSPDCLQGAILKAIFDHNLTDKRFLSLIIKD